MKIYFLSLADSNEVVFTCGGGGRIRGDQVALAFPLPPPLSKYWD